MVNFTIITNQHIRQKAECLVGHSAEMRYLLRNNQSVSLISTTVNDVIDTRIGVEEHIEAMAEQVHLQDSFVNRHGVHLEAFFLDDLESLLELDIDSLECILLDMAFLLEAGAVLANLTLEILDSGIESALIVTVGDLGAENRAVSVDGYLDLLAELFALESDRGLGVLREEFIELFELFLNTFTDIIGEVELFCNDSDLHSGISFRFLSIYYHHRAKLSTGLIKQLDILCKKSTKGVKNHPRQARVKITILPSAAVLFAASNPRQSRLAIRLEARQHRLEIGRGELLFRPALLGRADKRKSNPSVVIRNNGSRNRVAELDNRADIGHKVTRQLRDMNHTARTVLEADKRAVIGHPAHDSRNRISDCKSQTNSS